MAITRATAVAARRGLTLVLADDAGPALAEPDLPLQPPAGVALVPTEAVLLLAADLPAMTAAQRRAAVAFAVEDRIAQPLEDVQVVLGPQIAPGRWMVAVTARTVLARHAGAAALWPDVFVVPVPRAGISVWCGADRVLVRLPDGTGFATSRAAFPTFFAAAGSPSITLFGGVVPVDLAVTEHARLPGTPDPSLAGFDLRAGLRRSGGQMAQLRLVRPLALVVLFAAVAHLALSGLDVIALNRLANQRAVDLRAALMAPEGADLDAALAQALAARQPAETGGVLPLLSQTFAAISAQAGRVSVQDLRYLASDRAVVLTVEAPDLPTLQSIETTLTEAGLGVTAGAATTRDGAAEARMTIREGGA